MNIIKKMKTLNLPNFSKREIDKAIASYTYTYGAYMVMLDELISEAKRETDANEKELIMQEIVTCKNVLKSCTLVLSKIIGES